jgi:hypothetical protein
VPSSARTGIGDSTLGPEEEVNKSKKIKAKEWGFVRFNPHMTPYDTLRPKMLLLLLNFSSEKS